MKKGFKLLSAALIALSSFVPAQADEITLFDGTVLSEYAPIYGYNNDSEGNISQTIFPAASLEDLVGAEISSMKFYIADEGGNGMTSGTYAVSIGTTETSSFYNTPIEGLTQVAEITMVGGATEIVVNFDEPWTYEGGNIVIETKVISSGNFVHVNFFGQAAEVNNVLYGNWTKYSTNFYPKTTITYEGAVVVDYLATVSAEEIAFGQLIQGNEDTKTITLKNKGQQPFTPVFSALNAPFSLEVAAAELAPGASMTIPVKFVADAIGQYAQTLNIDCGEAGQFNVAITAETVEAPAEIVVCDGTAQSANYPVYGYYYDTRNSIDQMIYSEEILADLVGKKITYVTFHPTAGLAYGGGKLQLSFKVTEQSAFTSYDAMTDFTVVGTMVPVKGSTDFTIVLDEPYLYEGGNLAIETQNIETGGYGNTYFYGVNVEGYNPSFSQYGTYNSTAVSTFLPKATFGYVKEDTPEPQGKRGDVNGDDVVNIGDVTALIDYLLSQDASNVNLDNANCNGDADVNIGDVTALIDFLLSGQWPVVE